MDVRRDIERAIGATLVDMGPIGGGCIGKVYRVHAADGHHFVVKADSGPAPRLDIEAFMLEYLREYSGLPVPQIIFSSPSLLVMTDLPGKSSFSAPAQTHAAELLATLHSTGAPAFGLERDTLIGGLHQPNPKTESWLNFFREHRLLYMAEQGVSSGRLSTEMAQRVARFADSLERWLREPVKPSLIHGDVWTTNVLAAGARITGFLDPAIYYADPEIELAFTTLFGTFGEPFFNRYHEISPIAPGFFEERRDIYNLYPLLVHVRLFGGSYVSSVGRILSRFGF
jgi:fructosamine-3-kinase